MTSIRQRLLINLLSCIGALMIITATGVYYLGNNDVEVLMKRDLVHSNLFLQAMVPTRLTPEEINSVQQKLTSLPATENNIFMHESQYMFTDDSSTLTNYPLQYQVWDENYHIILHSDFAPIIPKSDAMLGFSTSNINGTTWHIYTSYNPDTKYTYIVTAQYALQSWLKESVAKDNIYIMLLTFPLFGILIWLILAHGLRSLDQVTYELSHRASNYLEPMDIKKVPEEIAGLVDELNKLLSRVKQGMDREQRFAGDAAHELRTPLAALRTQAQVAQNSTTDPDVLAALTKVIEGVERSTHVVQQLLTLSRLVPGSTMDSQLRIDLVQIAKDTIGDTINHAMEKDIELDFMVEQAHTFILGNPISIGIMMRNLIDNAIRYTPEKGRVEVDIIETKQLVIFRVSDNGPGIPAKLRGRVFERFFRVLGTKAPGSGLGLAIVQQIATLHNAHVRLGTGDNGIGLKVDIEFSK
jgi:two-component system sensor histidine kinase QseC